MSARKKKRAPDGVRKNKEWWEEPTFLLYRYGDPALAGGKVHIELILPSGERVDLGKFADTGNTEDLRSAVAEHFRKIWDPEKRRRRTPTI